MMIQPLTKAEKYGLETVIREIELHGVVEPYYQAFINMFQQAYERGHDTREYSTYLYKFVEEYKKQEEQEK